MLLHHFKPIIEAISHKIYFQNLDKEDLRQDLYVKLLEVYPRYQHLPEDEIKKICGTALKNHALNIVHKSKRIFSREVKNPELTILTEVESILIAYEIDYELNKSLTDIKTIILDWARTQTKDIQEFFSELVSPSHETTLKYQLFCQSRKRKTFDEDFINPYHLHLILKSVPIKKWKRALEQLKVHLKESGCYA